MATFNDINRLSSQALHDRAWGYAEHHVDVRFFWDLLELLPVAEAAEGPRGTQVADGDILHPQGLVQDALLERPELLETLRPVYIDYLMKHPDAFVGRV